jgi:hypothetical protein
LQNVKPSAKSSHNSPYQVHGDVIEVSVERPFKSDAARQVQKQVCRKPIHYVPPALLAARAAFPSTPTRPGALSHAPKIRRRCCAAAAAASRSASGCCALARGAFAARRSFKARADCRKRLIFKGQDAVRAVDKD